MRGLAERGLRDHVAAHPPPPPIAVCAHWAATAALRTIMAVSSAVVYLENFVEGNQAPSHSTSTMTVRPGRGSM